MAKVHGMAGEWARTCGMVLGLWPLFLGVLTAGFALALVFQSPLAGMALLVVALGIIAWSGQRGFKHIESYFKGARGEEKVSAILANLPEPYHVFNDFMIGRHQIDHVVLGPAGVFAIETKCWFGTVTVEEGHVLIAGRLPSRSPLRQVRAEAERVHRFLTRSGWTGTVTPVLAFASDTFDAVIAEVQGVVIVNSNHLRRSFETERRVLAPAEVERLVGIMEFSGR